MKKTATILAALSLSLALSNAGVAPVVTGKNPPPPPPVDPCAGPISYSNIELLYANTDWGGSGDNADGVVLRGEYSPMANLYLTAGVSFSSDDYSDDWFLHAGIGGYLPLTENIHVAADAGVLYNDVEYDYPTGSLGDDSDSDTGWYARPHLRAKFGCLTVHAGALYTDIWDEDDWSWFVNAYYQLNANWDLTAGYHDGDGFETVTAGVRFRF
jgi:hypothetical protein